MITLDWTLLITGVVFLFTLWALNKLLIKPLFRVLDERDALTVKAQASAREKMDYRETLFEEYAGKVKEEKQKGYQLAEGVRREALEARQARLIEARKEAEGLLGEARRKVEKEASAVKLSLKSDAEEMADMIAARVLEKT